jgi:hypothetical protein
VVAPKNIDPQRVIAEVNARFPAARDFDLTDMVEKALAWEEVKRNEDTTRARVMRALFAASTDRNYTALLALYVRGLTEPIKTEELLSAFRTYAPRATRKEEKAAKEQLSALYDLSETQAVLTDVGREVLTEWRDRATQTSLIRKAEASPRVLDLNGPIAHYFDKAEKDVADLYRNWPTRTNIKGFGAKLSDLLSERTSVPLIYMGQNAVAAGSYIIPIDVYQKIRGNRVDLFDPACDRTLGYNRTGKKAEDQINLVSPTQENIAAARLSQPQPVRGVSATRDSVDINLGQYSLSAKLITLLKKAGYSRFRVHQIPKSEMLLILDADTGKQLMLVMPMLMR